MRLNNKLFLSLIIAPLLVAANTTVFADNAEDLNPHFKVTIYNDLADDITATFHPTNYASDIWNGVCSDQVLHTLNKTLCRDVPELAKGIPASYSVGEKLPASNPYFTGDTSAITWDIPIQKFFDMPNGVVGFGIANAYEKAAYPLKPFEGDLVITKTTDGKEIAKIHYVLQIHQATRWSAFERSHFSKTVLKTPYDEGRYMQWDPMKTTSKDPGVNVSIFDSNQNWCWLNEKNSQGCSVSPSIVLSIHSDVHKEVADDTEAQ